MAARGYCTGHYKRWRKHGDPGGPSLKTHRVFAETSTGCRECGAPLGEGNDRRAFCSSPCRAAWHYRHRDRDLVQKREQAAARRHQQGRGVGVAASRACLECSKVFAYVVASGRPPELCSPECKVNRRRRLELLEKYGITLEEYEALWTQQRGLCAVCEGPLLTRSKDRFACVDHCHTTGAVRGLLCDACNLAMGQFGDDVERLRAAVRYLERGGARRA